jgi:hypothetical protein
VLQGISQLTEETHIGIWGVGIRITDPSSSPALSLTLNLKYHIVEDGDWIPESNKRSIDPADRISRQ